MEDADITDVILTGVYIKTDSNAGILATSVTDSDINTIEVNGYIESIGENSYTGGVTGFSDAYISLIISNVTIHSDAQNIGGITGINNGIVTESYYTGTITKEENGNIGGISGENNGDILNTYFNGVITSDYTVTVGGITGNNTGSVTNNYVTGSISYAEGSTAGGIIGKTNEYGLDLTTINNNYYLNAVISEGIGQAGSTLPEDYDSEFYNFRAESKTSAELQTESSYNNWDFEDIWGIPAGDYPVLLNLSVYYIVTLTVINLEYEELATSYGNITYGVNVLHNGTAEVKVIEGNGITLNIFNLAIGVRISMESDGVAIDPETTEVVHNNVISDHSLTVTFARLLYSFNVTGLISAEDGYTIDPHVKVTFLLINLTTNKTYLITLTHNQTLNLPDIQMGTYEIITHVPMYYTPTIQDTINTVTQYTHNYTFTLSTDNPFISLSITLTKSTSIYLHDNIGNY